MTKPLFGTILVAAFAAVFYGAGSSCNADVVYPKAPEGGQQMVAENVGQIMREMPNGPVLSERGLKMADVTIAEPHQEYAVGAKDLAAGRLLSAANSRTWRYILLHGTKAVGVATLFQGDAKTGNTLQFSGLFETDFSVETLEAVRRAKEWPQLQKQDYELRMLNVPAINFAAVWLHGKTDDIIIPLPPTFGRKLNAYQAYSESEIIKALRPEAEEVMKAPGLYR